MIGFGTWRQTCVELVVVIIGAVALAAIVPEPWRIAAPLLFGVASPFFFPWNR